MERFSAGRWVLSTWSSLIPAQRCRLLHHHFHSLNINNQAQKQNMVYEQAATSVS